METCNYCLPEIEDITSAVPLEISDLVKMREAVEAIGTKIKCGEHRETCIPLMLVQRRINKLNKHDRKE